MEHRLICDACGCDDFDDGGGDGFRYCISCGSQSQLGAETATLEEDVYGASGGGALYNLHRHRANPSASASSRRLPSKDKILEGLSQGGAAKAGGPADEELRRRRRSLGLLADEEPRNFAVEPERCTDPEVLAAGIRRRYVEGLQVMVQLQCEALVERLGVSPLICGLAGSVWLRYVAATRVFDKEWANKAIAAAAPDDRPKIKVEQTAMKPVKAKNRSSRQRSLYIWFHSLRKTIPLYSSLVISFLVCHLAREAVLPTDMYQWALEGKLPYLSAFVDIDRILGDPSIDCPLSSRYLFRPFRVIGAWQLEATAGSVAELIGLRLPSVNFYAIALRYLKELSLPVDKILPHACRLYAWSVPADLWLSSFIFRLPTRVCVMSILIVTIRILYNIHGQGVWERSLFNSSNSSSCDQSSSVNPDSMNLSSAQNFVKNAADAKECQGAMGMPSKNLKPVKAYDFTSKELLDILEAAYDRICITHDYSEDLRSYLKYCKDIVFAGITPPYAEDRLIERLWDTYNKQEDSHPQDDLKSVFIDLKGKRPRDEGHASTWNDTKKLREQGLDGEFTSDGTMDGSLHKSSGLVREKPALGCSSTAARNYTVERMKINMEENGFQYLPPRVDPQSDGCLHYKQSDGYLHYKRQRRDGRILYVAHTDYYILLRACATLAQVDVRIMHVGALKLEKRLAWIESRIGISLSSLLKHSPN